jgi:hypothetical protein
MIQQEELHIKQFTTGVTFYIFSDTIYNNLPESPSEYEGPFLSYVLFNDQNEIYSLNYFTGSTIWTRNNHNNYIPIGELGWNYQTGYTIVKTVASNLSQENIDSMTSLMLSRLSDPTRPGTPPSASAATNYVFYKKELIDDFYIDLKIERGYNSLDTLKINNNLVNSFPEQNSPTGVVFGRLTAIQKLKGEFGENIRIPLVNVPIGIFNSSDEFPSIFSTDENGDRLSLNIKEAANPNQYFNNYSYFSDYNQYLKSADSFSAVPAQYKYVTLTNDNGEFVLYDIPVGQQTAIFEVDLFKQGLTKDEIALNFFPFPGTEDANIDSTPSFVYKQFPVDVVPAWGLGQTGYTSLDININLDLRKWATFYVAPISVNGYQLESPELSNLGSALNVEVRDMSRVGFPTTNLPIVQIPNILEKDTDQALLWLNEFSQLTNVIKFYKNGFNAFKVRANMYDPNGYRTNSDGFPVNNSYNKGVWLAGYQFLMYFNNKSSIFRSTGFQRDWNLGVGRDNFHLNRGIESGTKNSETPPDFQFPYNKPWTIDFPEKYSIPHKPTQLNFDRTNPATRLRDSSNRVYLEQPLYLDGDMVGLAVNEASVNSQGVGGFGLQYSFNSNFYFGNRFAQEITNKSIYKYENRVSWGEKYSNGYEPSNPGFPVQPGVSSVLGGEKYQRVECGYGYWLKPDGWPPIAIDSYGDLIFTESLRPTDVLSSTSGPGELNVGDSNGRLVVKAQNIFIDIYNIGERDIALALDNEATFSEGGLDIYRVIDSNNFLPQGNPIVPTFVTFNFQSIYYQRGGNSQRIQTATKNGGGNDNEEFFSRAVGGVHGGVDYSFLKFSIKNNGIIPVLIPNTSITLEPNQTFTTLASSFGLDNLALKLPGNSNFDFINGRYQNADYTMEFIDITHRREDGSTWPSSSQSNFYNKVIAGTNVSASVNNPNYYLISRWNNVRTQYNGDNKSCENGNSNSQNIGGTDGKWEHSVKMDGALFETPNTNNGGGLFDIRFWSAPINATCGSYNFKDGVKSIAIEV